MNKDEGSVRVKTEQSIFEIIIDRPAKLNGFTPKMFREMVGAYNRYEKEDAFRCAVVTAEGDHFTAGLDLPSMASHLSDDYILTNAGEIDLFGMRPPFRTKPVICAVKGICYTLGVELMLAADVVVSAWDARFAQLEVKRGIMPAGGATARMVARAGWGNAMRYLLSGDEFGAKTAEKFGFVQEVVDPERVRARAFEIATSICANAPLAVRATITNSRAAIISGEVDAFSEIGSLQRSLLDSEDVKEGIESFKSKRQANFSGK